MPAPRPEGAVDVVLPQPSVPQPSAPQPSGGPRLARVGASVEALDGRILTRGLARITESTGRWTARLTQLDRPGVIASMFFAEKARDIVLRLDDGRHARARLASTSFIASSERVCDLTGIEPLI